MTESARSAPDDTPPLLAGRGIDKSFGPVQVLHGIDFDVRAGEVHAILGENGAGKSTLMKCLSGYLEPEAGEVALAGERVRWRRSAEAEAQGVVLIHQELNLAPDLSVKANVFLGRERTRGPFVDARAMRAETTRLLEELETPIDPRARVRDLSVSQMQMVEIAKAVARDARVLFMDEPTDVLTGRETEVLFGLIERLAARGVAIVYVSHKLAEIARIADRVTVLRDGERVATRAVRPGEGAGGDAEGTDPDTMARLMVGRELTDMYPERGEPEDEVVLAVRNAVVPGFVTSASFELRRGEVLGFAGLVGAGRTELFEGLLGLRPGRAEVEVGGRSVRIRTPRDAQEVGIAYLTEDRKGKGLITRMGLPPNVTLAALERFARPFLDRRAEREAAAAAVREFEIRVADPREPTAHLSGGNQQKVVLAKIMTTEPDIVVLDEPTRGIDVGTKRQIYFYIRELTRAGKAVALISSELPEILGLAHRVVVMRAGRVTGTLGRGRMSEEAIVRYATGLADDADPPPAPATTPPSGGSRAERL